MAQFNDWMQTASGKAFYPNTCKPGDFDIEDIAHALGNVCRFGGHTLFHYSVAQHSVLVADYMIANAGRYSLEALMHDATEAYIGDLIRPLKHDGSALGEAYLAVEKKLEQALASQFGLTYDLFGWPDIVKHCDNVALATEARDVMCAPPQPWHALPTPMVQRIVPLTPADASRLFLERYEMLVKQRGQETGVGITR